MVFGYRVHAISGLKVNAELELTKTDFKHRIVLYSLFLGGTVKDLRAGGIEATEYITVFSWVFQWNISLCQTDVTFILFTTSPGIRPPPSEYCVYVFLLNFSMKQSLINFMRLFILLFCTGTAITWFKRLFIGFPVAWYKSVCLPAEDYLALISRSCTCKVSSTALMISNQISPHFTVVGCNQQKACYPLANL